MNALSVQRYDSVVESTIEIQRPGGGVLDMAVTRDQERLTGFVVALYGPNDEESGLSRPLAIIEMSLVELLHLRTLLAQLEGSIGG